MTSPPTNRLEIEWATLRAWPALRRLSLFGWQHCATEGQSGRVNAIWPITWDGDTSLSDAIDHAIAWCIGHRIAPCFRIADGCFAPDALPGMLDARNFRPRTETLVMTRPIAPTPQPDGVELLREPDETIWAPLKESAPSQADFAERKGIVSRIKTPRVFARASLDGKPAAIGLAVQTDDLVGIYLMRTAPWARRRGLGRAVLRTLLGWGAAQGATGAYLQVEDENRPAVDLYAVEGFETLYRYRYWTRA